VWKQYKLTDLEEINEEILSALNDGNYERADRIRYSMLMEEGLIKWKESLGEDTGLLYERRDTGKNIKITLTCRGCRVYPYDSSHGDGDYLGRMHDRLLAGTGCEVNYRYFLGKNRMTLSLPKDNHEKTLFYRNAWALATPVMFQCLFTSLITATDSILMGVLDQDSLSAISITGSFMALYSILIGSLATGVTIYASQCWGKRDWAGINRVLSVALRYSAVCSLLFFIPAFFFPEWLMRIYTDIPQLVDLGSRYLRIVSGVILCTGFYQIYHSIMQNSGKVLISTVYMVISTLTNLVLDIVMIFGFLGFPAMGIEGAAYATLIAGILHLVLCLFNCIRDRNIHLNISLRVDAESKRLIRDYLKNSYPVAVQAVTWTLADNICTSIFGHMSTDIVAANGTVNIIQSLGEFGMEGIYRTCGILIGGKLGSNRPEEARLYGRRYLGMAGGVGFLTAVGVCILNVFAEYLPLSLSDQAFRALHILLVIEAFELFFIGINNVMNHGGFYAGGDTKALMVIDTVNMWGIIVPLSLLFMYVFKMPPIWVAVFLHMDELTSFPLKYTRYKKYKWLKKIT